jgi:Secretion system C-terminal sorting domain/Beta-propeller repeat
MKIALVLLFLSISILGIAQTPEWEWAITSTGTGASYIDEITTNDEGIILMAGTLYECVTYGCFPLVAVGENDMFALEIDSEGNFLWAHNSGGLMSDTGKGIATDIAGNIYIAGEFDDEDFNKHIFVKKINEYHNWIWLTQADCTIMGSISISDIAVDNNGNSYIIGSFSETAIFGSIAINSTGFGSDIFIAKIAEYGEWLWVVPVDVGWLSYASGIAVDDNGECYVTGTFHDSVNFGQYSVVSNGNGDIFVAKIDTDGNWLWVNSGGGDIDDDVGRSIVVDNEHCSYVTGKFSGSANFGIHNVNSTGYYNYSDVFAAKLDQYGDWFWVINAGSTSNDIGKDIAYDNIGNCYITGSFKGSADFGSTTLSSNSTSDVFVAKVNNFGDWEWAVQSVGTIDSFNFGTSIDIDLMGNCYVTGRFEDILELGPYQLESNEYYNSFVAKLGTTTSTNNQLINDDLRISNFPNPFNPTTEIRLQISEFSKNEVIEIEIYNLKGQKVKTIPVILSGVEGSVSWNGDDYSGNQVSSGVYFYKLKVGKTEITKKMLLMK